MPKRPVTFGARVVHFGRYGRDAEQQNLSPVYLGYPELLHGYGVGSFSRAECAGGTAASARCAVFDSLIGSRMLVANLEVRAPLVGLFRGDLQYGRVPIDIAMFMDAGVAWTHATRPTFLGGTRDVLRSVGGAMRLNTFGFFILEVSAARALDRADRQWQWQIGIRQGF
jgi:outer membrane protein assembly factor BamA